MISTRFTDLVGCTMPVQQAGMGGISPPSLAAAVSEAGGLGMLGCARPGVNATTLEGLIDEVRALTQRPFGVNFIVRAGYDPACIALAARTARVVEFFYTEPARELVDMVHDGGALVSWQIGSREEAESAQRVGCDFIIAQGKAAGGHVRGVSDTLVLLGEVLDTVDIPVLAAGGIGSGRDVAAMLTAGADGVRIGTRFIAATEASTHSDYVAALISARAEDTEYTEAFSTTWPGAPHRVLRSCIEAAEAIDDDVVGAIAAVDGTPVPVRRFGTFGIDRTTTGTIAAMSLFAGESVGDVTRVQPAAEIVRDLMGRVLALLDGE
jgi:nitronate monooxygenase